MAPTTRAATKRLRGNAPSTTTQPYKKNARKRAAFGPNAPDPSKSPTNNRCYLLELPPELRNQIYEFALEDYADLTYAPCILHKPDLAEAQLWADRIWTSFGLTHSCKQIRVEYRPLWLRNLFIRSRYLQIAPFIETFLPSAKELQQGPKRIQSEWNRGLGDYCGARRDLTSLVRLRAYGSLDQFKCVPHKLVVDAADRGDEDWSSPLEVCICAPYDDMEQEDWESYQYDLIKRSDIVRDVICHNNEKWFHDVRDEKFTVHYEFGKQAEPITFRLECEDRFCEPTGKEDEDINHADSAWSLLQQWDLFDLPSQDDMTFMVCCKTKTKMMKNGYEVASLEVREVRISKSDHLYPFPDYVSRQ